MAPAGYQTKIVLLLASSLTVMAGATISPSLPQMAQVFADLPHAQLLTKLVLTLPALAIALTAPMAGLAVDRWGRRAVLFPALLLYAGGGSLGFFVPDLHVILTGRFLLGVAVAGIMTTVVTLIGDFFSGADRARFMGMQAAFISLGGAVFVGLGGFLADRDWRYPFLIYPFSLIVLAVAALWLPDPERVPVPKGAESAAPLRSSELYAVLITAALAMAVFYMLPVQLPFVMREIGIADSSKAGLAIAVTTLASTITGALYGQLRKVLSSGGVFVLIFPLMAIGYLLVACSENFAHTLGAMVVFGLGLGPLVPNLNTWLLATTTERNRGRDAGLLSAALFGGQFSSPILCLPLIATLGLSGAFMGGAIALGALTAVFAFRAAKAGTRA